MPVQGADTIGACGQYACCTWSAWCTLHVHYNLSLQACMQYPSLVIMSHIGFGYIATSRTSFKFKQKGGSIIGLEDRWKVGTQVTQRDWTRRLAAIAHWPYLLGAHPLNPPYYCTTITGHLACAVITPVDLYQPFWWNIAWVPIFPQSTNDPTSETPLVD